MPHKHKRKATDITPSDFNLPPTQRATPLPVGKTPARKPLAKKRKVTTDYGADDTPRAFARLMAFKTRGKGLSGLDDGIRRKKPKPSNAKAAPDSEDRDADTSAPTTSKADAPAAPLKILPGEKLSDFSARVNQALPLSGVQRHGKKVVGVTDHRITRHEKKLKKLQAGWRKEEARIRDKELEERELAEEEQDELDAMLEDKTVALPDESYGAGKKKGGGKKKKRKLVAGEIDDDEEDPWEVLRKSREQRKGLHDVVQAPPTFDRVPREIFKVKDGARVRVGNVPSSAGSLRKREELAGERQTIIDTYRSLMAARKGD